jgi:hypothetical protein
MSDWYYARAGERFGPVSRMKIEEMARQGELAVTDLLWTESMTNWQAAGEVSGIFPPSGSPEAPTPPAPPGPVPAANPPPALHQQTVVPAPVNDRFLNPYATPQSERARISSPAAPAPVGEEIAPGSEPIDVGQIVRRSWQLTFRHYGFIFLVGVVYVGLAMAFTAIFSVLDASLGLQFETGPEGTPDGALAMGSNTGPFEIVGMQIISIWLGLGLTRIGLNLVSGAPVSVGQLFGQTGKFLKALVASILYFLMVGLGTAALIVPGIYLGLRFSQFFNAIADRDLGIFEAFRYSSALTTKNKWNLVALFFAIIFVFIGGLLALCVGLFIAYPMIWLMTILAYRWMQYGQRAVEDTPSR